MKSYRLKIKLQFLGDILLIVCAIILGFLSTHSTFVTDTNFSNYSLGLVAIHFALIGFFDGIRKGRLLYESDEMKKSFIKYTDERTVLIRSKALSTGFNISVNIIAVGVFILSDPGNKTIIRTVFIVYLFILFVRLGVNKYYLRKY
ncbi:MAG: hypothetical protein K0R18_2869 [Bacillales bacterium]|jgi:hypothetical protein|nr:hypothetical protein [Bacillales bacterium]